MNFLNQLFSCERFVASSRALRVFAVCGLVGACWGTCVQAETVTSGPGWIAYAGHIDDTAPQRGAEDDLGQIPPDDTTPDHMAVLLSQFDSSLGTLTKITLSGDVNLTWSVGVDATDSTDALGYSYGFNIAFDAPTSPNSIFVQAKLPTDPAGLGNDEVTGQVSAGSIYNNGGALNPLQTVNVSANQFAGFIGNGTVAFNILNRFADASAFDVTSSSNANIDWSIAWTGDVSVRYDYAKPTAVPLPPSVWGGSILLGLVGLLHLRKRVAL